MKKHNNIKILGILILIIFSILNILGCSNFKDEIKITDDDNTIKDFKDLENLNGETFSMDISEDKIKDLHFLKESAQKLIEKKSKFVEIVFLEENREFNILKSKFNASIVNKITSKVLAKITFIFYSTQVKTKINTIFENLKDDNNIYFIEDEFDEIKLLDNFKQININNNNYESKILELLDFTFKEAHHNNSNSNKIVKGNIEVRLKDSDLKIEKSFNSKIHIVNKDFNIEISSKIFNLWDKKDQFFIENFDNIENEIRLKEEIKNHFQEIIFGDNINEAKSDALQFDYKIEDFQVINNKLPLRKTNVKLLVSLYPTLYDSNIKYDFNYEISEENIGLFKELEKYIKNNENEMLPVKDLNDDDDIRKEIKEKLKSEISHIYHEMIEGGISFDMGQPLQTIRQIQVTFSSAKFKFIKDCTILFVIKKK